MEENCHSSFTVHPPSSYFSCDKHVNYLASVITYCLMDLWNLVACDFHELMNLPHTSRQATWKQLLGYIMRGVRYRKIWFRNPSCALGLSGKVGTAMMTLLNRHSSIRDSGLFCSQHHSIVELIWVIPATRRRSLTLVCYRRQYWYYLLLFLYL